MKLDAADCRTLDRSLGLEWLEADGRGGYASGTVAGANTRRYHALLLVARRPPVDRVVLVNHLEETLRLGSDAHPLSTNLYPGVVHPDGFSRCAGFTEEPWPTWHYEAGGVRLRRELFAVQGRNLVVIRWTALEGAGAPARLLVRPMLTGRDHHALHRENPVLRPEAEVREGAVLWRPYADLPAVRALHDGTYRHEPDWYRRVQYPIERERGLDGEEDWWSPGEIAFDLATGRGACLALTTEPVGTAEAAELARAEQHRRAQAVTAAPDDDPLARALRRASEAFIATRGAGKTVVAGYPWFTDWGRDTFISLPGLCLVTGHFDVARHVIEAFAPHVREGLVPNRFPDAGERPEYNTIDASLWFVQAVGRYLAYTGDAAAVEKVAWPAVRAILDGYRKGTGYGIRVDGDGLVAGGAPGVQLTWMDAKVGDWVVTPRRGKPVEVQALWVHALTVGEALARRFGDRAYGGQCAADRARAIRSFRERFWYEPGGYLYDVVDGEGGDDPSLRPNQIYAIALCEGLVPPAQARSVVRTVETRLLTPVGLRTLAPDHPHYRPRYEGGVRERDGAYHQGTVWPFLLGPFVTAWVKVHGATSGARRQARAFLDGLERHLGEACLGQVSEIFDAEPPHRPRGCCAQAWSVAEPLRALVEDIGASGPPRQG